MMNKKISRGRLLKTGSAVTSVGITPSRAWAGPQWLDPFFVSSWQSGSNR